MSYIGNVPTTASFPFDQFSGTGSQTAFTLSQAPASTTSIVVAVSGVVQNPNTYSVSGTTLTFTGAPPLGTNNIGVLFLGLPAIVNVPAAASVTPSMLSTGGPSWNTSGNLSVPGSLAVTSGMTATTGSFSGNLNVIVSTASLGYGTGAGSTVTQATSKSTGVTINTPTGRITMNNAALAAGATATFLVTNSIVANSDTAILAANAFGLNYRIESPNVIAGGFYIRVTNITAGSLSEAITINFTIIKGVLA